MFALKITLVIFGPPLLLGVVLVLGCTARMRQIKRDI